MKGSLKRTGSCRVAEVFVVLCMVAVLFALLFPAVQEVRRAAERAQCLSNLRQMAIAIQDYGDSHEASLPVGTVANPQLKPDQRLSWIVAILPFLE